MCIYRDDFLIKWNSSRPKLASGGKGYKGEGGVHSAIDCIVTNACVMGTPRSCENKAGSDTVG